MSLLLSFKRSVAAASIVAAGVLSSAAQAHEKPANDQAPQKAPKVAHNSNTKPRTADPANGITEGGILIGDAGDYSAEHMVIAIAILKGKRDEQINKKTGKPFTGEEIGEVLAKRLNTKGVPLIPLEYIKVFVKQTDFDGYARAAYFVKGRLIGGVLPLERADLMRDAVQRAFELEYLDELYPDKKIRPLVAPPKSIASAPAPSRD